MTSDESPTDSHTAVLLVHGIGSQEFGATLKKFLSGLEAAFPSIGIEEMGGRAIATLGARVVYVYEVYWADLLDGDAVTGTFDPYDANSLAWFPWLNLRANLYSRPSRLKILFWTCALAPLGLTFQLVRIVLLPFFIFSRRTLASCLDRSVGDVTNYCASVGRAAKSTSPVGSVAIDILGRFHTTLRRAVGEGCGDVEVIAHSLGSVIAYHALTNYPLGHAEQPPDLARQRVRRLYTIGSPLGKIHFVWPMLIPSHQLGGEAGADPPLVEWHNFHDLLDLISGRLKTGSRCWGAVQNHGLFGRGGLARAHVVYQRDPAFLRTLGANLFGAKSQAHLSPVRWAGLSLLSIAESLGFLGALVLPLGVAAGIGAVSAIVIGAFGAIGSYLDPNTVGAAVQFGFGTVLKISIIETGVFLVLFIVVAPIAYGRYKAAYAHYAFRFQEFPYVFSTKELPLPETSSWWRRKWDGLTQPTHRRMIEALWIAGLACSLSLGFGAWRMLDGTMPWNYHGNPGVAALIAGVIIVIGLFAGFVIGMVVFLSVGTTLAIRGSIKSYREWVMRTMRPPKGWTESG